MLLSVCYSSISLAEDTDMKYIDQVKQMNKDMIKNAGKNTELQGIKETNDAFNNKSLKSKEIDEASLNKYQKEMDTKFKDRKETASIQHNVKDINQHVEKNKEFAPIVSPTGAGAALTPEQIQELEKDSTKFVEYALKTLENAPKDIQQLAESVKKRGEELNAKSLERERERIAKLNGIDLHKGKLYYFLSFEMPLEMLRSYALESMYTGGVVVFRGMKEGRTQLREFMQKDLYPLMWGANNENQIGIKVEPQLFDMFKINVAPTIVYSENLDPAYCFVPNEWTYAKKENIEVEENGKKVIKTQIKEIPLKTESCLELNPEKYWKISGAVTSFYALEQFIANGAPGAQVYLDTLKNAYSGKPAKDIKGFSGEWKSPIAQEDLDTVKMLEDIAIKHQNDANNILNQLLNSK